MPFMNLLTGFFGVPWLLFFTKQFGLCFFIIDCFVSGFCLFVQENIWLVIWLGWASGGGSYQ